MKWEWLAILSHLFSVIRYCLEYEFRSEGEGMGTEFDDLRLIASEDWQYAYFQLNNGEYVFCVVCYGCAGADYRICFYPLEQEKELISGGGFLELTEHVRKNKDAYLAKRIETDLWSIYLEQKERTNL